MCLKECLCFLEHVLLHRLKNQGTVLVERTQSFTLGQSLGFGLGSGLGYVLAVLLVTEARHRLRSKAIPEAFRGLPITLVYIGVLALAIYGFTGHSVIL